jgi:hypothetical protein
MASRKAPEEALFHVLMSGSIVGKDLDQVSEHAREAFQKRLTGPRSGSVYTTRFFTSKSGTVVPYGVRPPHQASAPGEAPAFDTGTLLRGISFKQGANPQGGWFKIMSAADYGPYLEKGTSRMKPRPFFTPTVLQDIVPHMRRTVRDGIEKRQRKKARQLGGKG